MANFGYDAIEAVRTTLRDDWSDEADALSLTQTKPSGNAQFILTTSEKSALAHTSYPVVLVVPFPRLQDGAASHETNLAVDWHIPIDVRCIFRDTTGVEATMMQDTMAYQAIIDRVLNKKQGEIVSTGLLVDPTSFRPGRMLDAKAALWVAEYSITLQLNVDYS